MESVNSIKLGDRILLIVRNNDTSGDVALLDITQGGTFTPVNLTRDDASDLMKALSNVFD